MRLYFHYKVEMHRSINHHLLEWPYHLHIPYGWLNCLGDNHHYPWLVNHHELVSMYEYIPMHIGTLYIMMHQPSLHLKQPWLR